jgi:site-specific DNA recombinase
MVETVKRPTGRIAIYVRVSSRGQEDNESIPSQIAACRELAYGLGYIDEQIDVFDDVHTGEELWERDEMTRLRKLIERRVYDALVVYCVDRLARKVTHQMIIEEECRHVDCTIHYVQGGPPDTREGRLVRQVEGIVAEMEHEKIVERTNRGRREKLKAGKVIGNGKPPFGYLYSRDDRGKPIGLMPDPTTAHYVVGMYERLSKGYSLCAIARWLNAERVPVPGAGRKRRLTKDIWYSASVRFIIKNSTYKGEIYVGKQRSQVVVDLATGIKRKKLVRQPPEKWVKLESHHIVPLVSSSLWDNANNRLRINQQRSLRNNKHQDRFMLRAGFVFCGECGSIMYAKYTAKVGDYYACSSQWRENKRNRCAMPTSILSSQLDTAIWNIVEHCLKHPDALISHIEQMYWEDTINSLQPEIEKIDNEIGKLSTKIRNTFEELVSIDDTAIKETIRGQLVLWQKHLAQFKSDKEALISRQQCWVDKQEQRQLLTDYIADISSELEHLSMETKRKVLDALGVKVKVYKAPRKGPQEPDAPPRWVMTWDLNVSPEQIVNDYPRIPIHNRILVRWFWDGYTFIPNMQ